MAQELNHVPIKLPVETVVFDLGGVLIDWNPDYVYRHIYPDPVRRQWFFENICTHEWNLEQDAGRPLAEATAEKVAEFPEYAEQIQAFYGRWEEMLGEAIAPNVALLKQLRAQGNVRLYALTNWSQETFPIALDRFDFLQWFEGIVVSGLEGVIKPYREIYEILLSRYSIPAATSVFIDDNYLNVEGARAAGMQALHYTEADQLRKDLAPLLSSSTP